LSPTTKQPLQNLRPSIEPGVAFQRPTPAPTRAHDPLRGSVAEFFSPAGSDMIARTAPLASWIEARREQSLWPYHRAIVGAVGATATAEADYAEVRQGLNFASQDYLSLAAHPAVRDAAVAAIREHGLHSAGSSVLQGRSDISRALERELAETLAMEHVVLFPTGWGAAYSVVTALVRPEDHVVMDRLAHASLQAGAQAATKNVVRTEHLSLPALYEALTGIRATDAKNGILVITEGLFSMDSDSPDLRAMQALCREFGATLLVDVAHDFGALGPGGTGHIGRCGMLGEVDLVIGAFSKTFGSNGGFVATNHLGVRSYLEVFGGPHTFSNALSPVQVATVRESLRIVRSDEGERRRIALMSAVGALRAALGELGLPCLGDPSAVVPVLIGHTPLARLACRAALKRGLFTNLVEFPAVGIRAARFRMQVQADHTPGQAFEAAALLSDAVEEAKAALSSSRAD
jgi:7-keto-8-aminopelargonate synthetase-like enzyme